MNPHDGWVERVALSLVERAARKAPASLSARLEEEWLADLEGRRGAIARLSFALGCCRATRVIALELAAPVRATAATGGKTATLFGEPGPSILSRRTTVFVLIGILHALVILGLASGMTREVSQTPPPRIQVTLASNVPLRPAPPPPSTPSLVQFHPVAPLTPWTGESPAGAITVATAVGPPAVAAATPGRVVRVTGGPGRGFPDTADYYPAPSIRLAEKGVATVRVCVDGAGRLTADPQIAQSSGSARLDAGALRLAKAGSGRYRPSTEDGRPVSSCYPFGIRFELK
ncbi:MAG: energy transducer TonB [Steroidobacteraceae bacterium]|jgi:periplasmic protein TonB